MAATTAADAMERSVPFNDDHGVIIELGKDSQAPNARQTRNQWVAHHDFRGRLATYSGAGAVTDARPVAGSNGVDACSWVTTQ
jgi:hypothetical protein